MRVARVALPLAAKWLPVCVLCSGTALACATEGGSIPPDPSIPAEDAATGDDAPDDDESDSPADDDAPKVDLPLDDDVATDDDAPNIDLPLDDDTASADDDTEPADDDDRGDDDVIPDLVDTLVDPVSPPEPPDGAAPLEPTAAGGNGATPSDPTDPTPAQPSRPLRYLRSDPDSRLVIEIDSVPGTEPRGGSEDDFIERFSALLDKPDGIDIVHDDILESQGADHPWTDAELQELSRTMFDDDEPPGTVSAHVMFLDGSYQTEDGGVVLAVAWGNRAIAMFTDVIDDSCAGLPDLLGGLEQDACQAAEFGVWSHEMGHVLGLVNNGLEMQRDYEDPEHPHHDINEGCLMYWAYDGPSFVTTTFERLGSGEGEIDFCEDSLDDLAAARGE